jgi:hypothetical protein
MPFPCRHGVTSPEAAKATEVHQKYKVAGNILNHSMFFASIAVAFLASFVLHNKTSFEEDAKRRYSTRQEAWKLQSVQGLAACSQ